MYIPYLDDEELDHKNALLDKLSECILEIYSSGYEHRDILDALTRLSQQVVYTPARSFDEMDLRAVLMCIKRYNRNQHRVHKLPEYVLPTPKVIADIAGVPEVEAKAFLQKRRFLVGDEIRRYHLEPDNNDIYGDKLPSRIKLQMLALLED